MFWKYNAPSSIKIDTLLEKEDICLQDLFDEEELLQECKAENEKLLQFLLDPEVMEELVELLVTVPSTDVEVTAQFSRANLAAEVLTCDVLSIVNKISSSTHLMQILYQYLEQEEPLNPLLASFVTRVFIMLVERRPKQNWYEYQIMCFRVLEFFRVGGTFVSVCSCHIGTSAVAGLLRAVTCRTDGDDKDTDIKIHKWLDECGLMEQLVHKVHPSCEPQEQTAAAQLICDIVSWCHAGGGSAGGCVNNVANGNGGDALTSSRSPLLDTMESEALMASLLDCILDTERTESSVTNTVTVLRTLLSFYKTSLHTQQLNGEDKPSEVVKCVINRLPKIQEILTEPSKCGPLLMASGESMDRVGGMRLQLVGLFESLMTTKRIDVRQAIAKLNTMVTFIDLFFKFSLNNFLHTMIVRCVRCILGQDPESEPPMSLSNNLANDMKFSNNLVNDMKSNTFSTYLGLSDIPSVNNNSDVEKSVVENGGEAMSTVSLEASGDLIDTTAKDEIFGETEKECEINQDSCPESDYGNSENESIEISATDGLVASKEASEVHLEKENESDVQKNVEDNSETSLDLGIALGRGVENVYINIRAPIKVDAVQSSDCLLLRQLFKECCLLQRIMDSYAAQQACEQNSSRHNLVAYMGHVRQLANSLLVCASEDVDKGDQIEREIDNLPNEISEKWSTFVSTTLADDNLRNKLIPLQSLRRSKRFSSDDEGSDDGFECVGSGFYAPSDSLNILMGAFVNAQIPDASESTEQTFQEADDYSDFNTMDAFSYSYKEDFEVSNSAVKSAIDSPEKQESAESNLKFEFKRNFDNTSLLSDSEVDNTNSISHSEEMTTEGNAMERFEALLACRKNSGDFAFNNEANVDKEENDKWMEKELRFGADTSAQFDLDDDGSHSSSSEEEFVGRARAEEDVDNEFAMLRDSQRLSLSCRISDDEDEALGFGQFLGNERLTKIEDSNVADTSPFDLSSPAWPKAEAATDDDWANFDTFQTADFGDLPKDAFSGADSGSFGASLSPPEKDKPPPLNPFVGKESENCDFSHLKKEKEDEAPSEKESKESPEIVK